MTAPPRPVPDHRLCVAPMMAYTDRDFRFLLRLISRRVLLYTEMQPAGAILRGDAVRRLAFHPSERPLAVQFGGADPAALAECARRAADAGFDEVNLNVGCPSERVGQARFGACLMAEPERVAACVEAMRAAAPLPVTVKTRIGIDAHDEPEFLRRFVGTVAAAGCRTFIVHARKAWLKGLSPRQNRERPPLRREAVHRLKREFPEIEFVVNGGITTLQDAREQLGCVDGAMIGRGVCADPYLLARADQVIFGDASPPRSRIEILRDYLGYAEGRRRDGAPVHLLLRHLPALFHGQRGVGALRRRLHALLRDRGAGVEALLPAFDVEPSSFGSVPLGEEVLSLQACA